jgi:hypothetical protein
MHRKIASRLIEHSRQCQARQRTAEALRHAVAMRETHAANIRQREFWSQVVELLKQVHLRP